MTFKDHFSTNSSDYSTYRPSYSTSLYSYLASLCPATETAWDCATGTGQAAVALTEYFEKVIATDASPSQIDNAKPHEHIQYLVSPAERCAIDSASIDLITVAQALHWFELDAFAHEAHRVMKPDAVLAAWTYNLLHISPEINETIYRLYEDIVGEYWPFERKTVEGGYADITLPFEPIEAPSFEMKTEWDLSQLCGYLNTWSAVKRYQETTGDNPVEMIFDALQANWEAPEKTKVVCWPLAVKVWRNNT